MTVHDFPDPKLGKPIPHGVFDLSSNERWFSVGIDHDTAQIAVASSQREAFRRCREVLRMDDWLGETLSFAGSEPDSAA